MEVEEFARTWVHAMNQRDLETLRGLAHPEVEVHFLVSAGGEVWGGDFKQVYRGMDEAFGALDQWSEAWSELRLDIDHVAPEPDGFVLHGTWHGVGRGSGVEVSASSYVAHYTLVDGKVRKMRFLEPHLHVEQASP